MGRTVFAAILTLALVSVIHAQGLAPGLVNYQGQLRDDQGQPLPTADYAMSFSLYSDAIGGDVIWGPQTFPAVPVAIGHFNVILGPGDDTVRPLNGAFASEERYLEISVGGSVIGPRQRILSAPYAITANRALNADDGVPPGVIAPFAGTILPQGWLRCDGSTVSREAEANLFAAIGTSWGVGDGATTFNLPDLRGQFLRGVDEGTGVDPNADVRGPRNGGNSGDAVGTYQDWATGRPRLNNPNAPGAAFDTNSAGNHSHSRTNVGSIGSTRGFAVAANQSGSTSTSSNGAHTHIIDGGGNSETRPDNASVYFIIKR